MRAPFAAAVLLLFGLSLVSGPSRGNAMPGAPEHAAKPAVGDAKVSWLAFDAAIDKAKKENKHMIVDVYTT
jgi:hypothetical protein